MTNFWTNLFNHKKTYIKPKKPIQPKYEWNLQTQIRISKTITILKRHKNQKIQFHKTQIKAPPKRHENS